MFLMINVMDILSILFLIFLEGMLSIDNALVLAMTVRHLPPEQQKRALTYGIWGAFAFRIIALLLITTVMEMVWLKLAAAIYLIWLGAYHIFYPHKIVEMKKIVSPAGFWRTIVLVEVLDAIFSLDSIFMAVGISKNMVVIIVGGLIGIVMMRVAAKYFISFIDRFKKLETFAYILIVIIGIKLGVQALI